MSGVTDVLRERARAALPESTGEVRLPGLHGPVEIRWDRWGVPHVYAGDTHDLFFTQGYVLASERLFQMDLAMRLGAGRLSEVFGELALPLDRFIRAVGWNRAARGVTERWDDLSWEMAGSFTAGIHAWLDRMPARPVEYEALDLDPLFAEGGTAAEAMMAASVFMAWSLSTNWDVELLRTAVAERLGAEAVATLFPDLPTESGALVAGKKGGRGGRRAALDLLLQAPAFPGGQGSNNWVVAGRRSVTGMPLLANDPHLFAQLPSVWYEIHLTAPGIEVTGVSLPFAPGVIIGHNDRIAWGITNLGGDVQDLFLERLNPEGTEALYEGVWEPVSVHREEIAVRGRQEPEVVVARETRHGPILDSYLVGMAAPEVVIGGIRETYALRWVGTEEISHPSTVYRLNTATNFDQFRAALAEWAAPGGNFVYADVDGNIGYQAAGAHPVRRRGDGTVPVPGWTGTHEWDGFVPFEELPWSYNPDEGFLATANNKIHDDAYPHLIGKDFLPPYRARRIVHLLTERAEHDLDSFRSIHMDTVSLPAMEVLPHLLTVEPVTDRQKHALGLLAEWDFDLAPQSGAAALYEVWSCRIGDVVLRPRLGEELYDHYFARRQWSNSFQCQVLPNLLAFPTATWFGRDGGRARDDALREALDQALDELTARLGEDMASWSWGALHRVRFAGRLAIIPELAELFTAAEGPLGGDDQTVLQGLFEPGGRSYDAVVVPSWRMVVDLADLDASVGTHTVGQSGNPASPHFADLYPLWATGQYHPLPFTRAAVEAETASVLGLLPQEVTSGG
jgi:penicillin amidase